MNEQTKGHLKDDGMPVDGFHTLITDDGLEVAEVITGPATAALLAAAYTSYDRAGRELGIDATVLAQSLDLVTLIRGAQTMLAYVESQDKASKRIHPFAPDVMPMREALAKLPQSI